MQSSRNGSSMIGSSADSTVTFQAVHVYKGNVSKCQLSFNRGDLIVCDAAHVSDNKGGGWLWGSCNTASGWFPPKFVKQVVVDTSKVGDTNPGNGSITTATTKSSVGDDDPFAGLPLAAVVPEQHKEGHEEMEESNNSIDDAVVPNSEEFNDQDEEHLQMNGDCFQTNGAAASTTADEVVLPNARSFVADDEEDDEFGDFDNGVKQEQNGDEFGSFDGGDDIKEVCSTNCPLKSEDELVQQQQHPNDNGGDSSANRETILHKNNGPRTLELPSPEKLGIFLLDGSYSSTNGGQQPPPLPFIGKEDTTIANTYHSNPRTSDGTVTPVIREQQQQTDDYCDDNEFVPNEQPNTEPVVEQLSDCNTNDGEKTKPSFNAHGINFSGGVHAAAAATCTSRTALELPSPEKIGIFLSSKDSYYTNNGGGPKVPFLDDDVITTTTNNKNESTTKQDDNNNSLLPLSSRSQFVSFDNSKLESFYSVKESFGSSSNVESHEVANEQQQQQQQEESPIMAAGDEDHFIDAVEDEEDFGSFDDGNKDNISTTKDVDDDVLSVSSSPCKFELPLVDMNHTTTTATRNDVLNEHDEEEFGDFDDSAKRNDVLNQQEQQHGDEDFGDFDDGKVVSVVEDASTMDDFGSFDGGFSSTTPESNNNDALRNVKKNYSTSSAVEEDDRSDENSNEIDADNIIKDVCTTKDDTISSNMMASNAGTFELPSPTKLGYFVEAATTTALVEDSLHLPFALLATVADTSCSKAKEEKKSFDVDQGWHTDLVNGESDDDDTDDAFGELVDEKRSTDHNEVVKVSGDAQNIVGASTAKDHATSSTIKDSNAGAFELPSPEKLGYFVDETATQLNDAQGLPFPVTAAATDPTCSKAKDEHPIAVEQEQLPDLENEYEDAGMFGEFGDGLVSSSPPAVSSTNVFLNTNNSPSFSEPQHQVVALDLQPPIFQSIEKNVNFEQEQVSLTEVNAEPKTSASAAALSDAILVEGDTKGREDQCEDLGGLELCQLEDEARQVKIDLDIKSGILGGCALSANNLHNSTPSSPTDFGAHFNNDVNQADENGKESEELRDFDQIVSDESGVKPEQGNLHTLIKAVEDDAEYWKCDQSPSQLTDSNGLHLHHQTAAATSETFSISEFNANENDVDDDFGDFDSATTDVFESEKCQSAMASKDVNSTDSISQLRTINEDKDFAEDLKDAHASLAEKVVIETLDSSTNSQPFMNHTSETEEFGDFGDFGDAVGEQSNVEVTAKEIEVEGDEFGEFADFGDAMQVETQSNAVLLISPVVEAAFEDSSFGDFAQPDEVLSAYKAKIEDDHEIMAAKSVFESIFPLPEGNVSYPMEDYCPSLLSEMFLVGDYSLQHSGWAERTLLECFADVKARPDTPAGIICVPSTRMRAVLLAQEETRSTFGKVVEKAESTASLEAAFTF